MFKWSCALMDKGKKCVRGYNYMGRLCEGCSWYMDEKVHYQPQIKVTPAEFEKFKQEIEEFEDWLEEYRGHDLSIFCEVDSIKPRFIKQVYGKSGQFRLAGYLLICKQGYIGNVNFEDYFYITISPGQQERLRLAPGDCFEARGALTLDHGRVVFPKIGNIEFESRSGKDTWTNSKALVVRQTAVGFSYQHETCLHCHNGMLVDVVETHQGSSRLHRELYCLEGVQDPILCSIHAFARLNICREVN